MRNRFHRQRTRLYRVSFAALLCLVLSSASLAVSSKITRHKSSADLLKGETEDVVIGSRGTIQLGRTGEAMVEEFEDVWSINSIVESGGTVYLGTSPNGGIYKYSLGKLTKIYPPEGQSVLQKEPKAEAESEEKTKDANDANDPNESSDLPEDSNTTKAEEHLSNEHIFAMATDVSGRLLAGMSGDKCRLCRFEADKMEVIFEPNDAKYIFAIAIDEGGNIYLGTGPQGKIYRSDPFGKEAKVIYDSIDKNILSLTAGRDKFIYAGSDSRGLVYKINPQTQTATVLYDSEQPEITALLFTEDGDLHAAATSAKIVQSQTQFAAKLASAGRPETKAEKDKEGDQSKKGRKLKIANTGKPSGGKSAAVSTAASKMAKPTQASHIYKISKEGFVTDVFSEMAVFFCLAEQDEKMLVGTGNSGQLFTIEPASEQEAVIYEDEQAPQITAIAVSGDDTYLGTANPAKLIKVGKTYSSEGTYTSDLIDAGQPAKWGKLQIEADIPQKCRVRVASRSGNVKDVNDPTFSDWTELTEITEPIQLRCPMGRFCQYKLVLQSEDGKKSPIIREIAVASTVPNLAPKVESVGVTRLAVPGKKGMFKIGYKAEDDNGDKLIYKIDFRKLGRKNWIELEDEFEKDTFEWDGKTVEDGRYEIRITVNDQRSNTTATWLTGSRISEPVVVDNTGPAIKNFKTSSLLKDNGPCRVFEFEALDELSAIGKLEYTIDSNADWIGAVPEDLVYDTTDENFSIEINTDKDLPRGDHVLTIKVSDAVGNTTYKTFEVNIEN